MSEVQITGGTVKYGRTIKVAEYENKRGDVELSFIIPEDCDPDTSIELVRDKAIEQLYRLLGLKIPGETDVMKDAETMKKPGPRPGSKAKPFPVGALTADLHKDKEPKAAEAVADPAAITDEVLPEKPAKPTKAKAAEEVTNDSLDDLMGGAKEITDIELMAATTRCNARLHNQGNAQIRQTLNDLGLKSPPGRIVDLPQDKRAAYLTALDKLKPAS